jgi:hypothetical protein
MGTSSLWKIPAARAASTSVSSKTSEKCSTLPAPEEAITGNAVQQDLSCTQLLTGLYQLDCVDVASFPAAFDGALIPAEPGTQN